MNNATTFETAKNLKEAGFPQPKPEAGQFWYYDDEEGGRLRLCVAVSALIQRGNTCIMYEYGTQALLTPVFDSVGERMIFAPTALDILREIPGHNLAFVYETGWHCFFIGLDGVIYSEKSHKCPHEAAALHWFAAKEVKNETV